MTAYHVIITSWCPNGRQSGSAILDFSELSEKGKMNNEAVQKISNKVKTVVLKLS